MPKPDPTKQAHAAAEAIRELNHITLNERLPAPRISAVAQNLCTMLDRLPQLLEQLGRQVQQRAADGAIRMDDGTNPAVAAADVEDALADTARRLDSALDALRSAASPLFHMGAK